MGVDQARHDGFARSVNKLIAGVGRNVLVLAGVLDPAVLANKNESVLDRHRAGTIDEFSTDDRILLPHGSSSWAI